jgi:hypothetical protein
MKPIPFPEVNTQFAKDQPEYNTLPALRGEEDSGPVVTCWKLTFRERLRVLFTGKVWLCCLTFHRPLQPLYMTTEKSELV